jgi:PAS domain S-box-containing protein
MDHALVIADRDGTIIYWNTVAEELFGYPAHEAIGSPVDLIVPEQFRDPHWEGFRRVMAGGERHLQGAATHIPVRVHTGQVHAFPGRFIHIDEPGGNPIGALAVFTPRAGGEQPWTPIDD